MKHIYITYNDGRGTEYGIGSYVNMLKSSIKRKNIKITILKLNSPIEELMITMCKNIRIISVPYKIYCSSDPFSERYYSAVPFVLLPYINPNEKNIFHLNSMHLAGLVKGLKQYFNGYIVLTVHYTQWSLELLGERKKLLSLLIQNDSKLSYQERLLKGQFYKEKELICHQCDKVIAISQHSFNDILSIYKIDPRKVVLINNALNDSYKLIDDQKYDILKRRYQIDMDEKIILFVGRLDKEKGIHVLIEAYKKVYEKLKSTRLLIAGAGYGENIQRLLALSSPLWVKINFTGYLSKPELRRLYHIADIGIIPSLHEEFGYVAIEMMMYELPIIVNDTTGLSEIVDDGINGMKVKIKPGERKINESALILADKMIELLESPDLHKQLGVNARKKFKQNYDLSLFRKKILDLYNSCFVTSSQKDMTNYDNVSN